MRSIFVVFGFDEIEGCAGIICAFSKPRKAEEFAEKCSEYEGTKEPYPDNDDDEYFLPWLERTDLWRRDHPAGEYEGADEYRVKQIDLDPVS